MVAARVVAPAAADWAAVSAEATVAPVAAKVAVGGVEGSAPSSPLFGTRN